MKDCIKREKYRIKNTFLRKHNLASIKDLYGTYSISALFATKILFKLNEGKTHAEAYNEVLEFIKNKK